jgi:hypothetical protein
MEVAGEPSGSLLRRLKPATAGFVLPFATIASKFHFRPVELVAEFYFNCVEHYELRSRFLL